MRKDIRLGMLPDPFIMGNGERVKSLEDWEIRRKEIIEDAISLEFDGMPPKPEVFKVEQLNGGTRGKLPAFFKIHCGKKDKPSHFVSLLIYLTSRARFLLYLQVTDVTQRI